MSPFEKSIYGFITDPFPLWECIATKLLVDRKWQQLKAEGLSEQTYHTTWFLREDGNSSERNVSSQQSFIATLDVVLELPSPKLSPFYQSHGLEPLSQSEIEESASIEKLRVAFEMLRNVPEAYDCIGLLVKCIQVLKQPDPEIDISYSHPDIPFTIFVTVCQDAGPTESLRVAESILHEAMHLKLSLIEEILPLIKPNAAGRYFSPWRDEPRPAKGVLHGLFVFRAVLEYLEELGRRSDANLNSHSQFRIFDIKEELNKLESFLFCPDLTSRGTLLTKNLLPSS